MRGQIVVTGCAGFIGSHLRDRLLADGHAVVSIDSFEDYYTRAIKEANLEGARANPAFTLHEANILELAGEHLRGLYHANHGLDTWADNGPARAQIGWERTTQSAAGLLQEFALIANVQAEWI